MAEKKVEKTVEKEAKVTEKKVVVPAVAGDVAVEERKRRATIVWIVIVGVVLIFILAILLIVTVAHQYVGNDNDTNTNGYSQNTPAFRSRNGWSQAQVTTSSSSTDGPTTTTTQTTYTLTRGVVTSVDGDSLTVAGNGKAQKITTNSSTTYVNDQKPQTNDSVAVWGTSDSNGTVTAKQVEVLNN